MSIPTFMRILLWPPSAFSRRSGPALSLLGLEKAGVLGRLMAKFSGADSANAGA